LIGGVWDSESACNPIPFQTTHCLYVRTRRVCRPGLPDLQHEFQSFTCLQGLNRHVDTHHHWEVFIGSVQRSSNPVCFLFDDEPNRIAKEVGSRQKAFRLVKADDKLVCFYLPLMPEATEESV